MGAEIEEVSGDAAAVTLDGTYPRERFPSGLATWTAPSARLRAPASSGVLTLLAWAPRPTPAQLELWLDGALLAGPLVLPTSPWRLQVFLGRDTARPRMELELRSAPFTPAAQPGQAQRAPLGIVIADLELDTLPGSPAPEWRGRIEETRGTWAFRSVTRGLWDSERFESTLAAWSKPQVTMRLPGGPGTLDLTVLAPRLTRPRFEVWASGRRLAGPVDPPPTPITIAVAIPADLSLANGLELELRSIPFVPASAGGRDNRTLGVVLSRLAFVPAASAR